MKAALVMIAVDLLGLSGAAAITYGVWLMNPPGGWIAGGLFALGAAVTLARE